MGELRSEWQQRKTALDRVGVKTAIFSRDLGPSLDRFDSAVATYDRQRKKYDNNRDPNLRPYATGVRQACVAVGEIARPYEETMMTLSEKATDPRQKTALEGAESWLLSLLNTLNQVQKKLPA